jgi:CelD/BcsL family acetyltransferase involved in cellulose biosynthesis
VTDAAVLELDEPLWSDFVRAAPGALPFHEPAWASLLAECYGYRAFALAVMNGVGITAGLPVLEVPSLLGGKRWVSLPFTDHCAPLTNGGEPGLAQALDEARQAAGISQLEVRAPLTGRDTYATGAGLLHVLDLAPDPNTVFRHFKPPVRRHVRNAERSGVSVRRGESAADLTHTFYRLHLMTRRRQGIPVQPRRFFDLLWHRFLARGRGFVLLASVGDEAVAGAVFLTGNGTVIYKYGASDPRALALRPNHAVFWAAIRWACENGYRTLDFGRTDFGHDGLRAFKSGWGAREQSLVYATVADKLPRRSAGHFGKVAKTFIQGSPQWVCRGAGELLYRYAA